MNNRMWQRLFSRREPDKRPGQFAKRMHIFWRMKVYLPMVIGQYVALPFALLFILTYSYSSSPGHKAFTLAICALFVYFLLLMQVMVYSLKKLAAMAYELIYKYDLWYYLMLENEEASNVSRIYGFPLYHTAGFIPNRLSFLSKIIWFTRCPKPKYIVGQAEALLVKKYGQYPLEWPSYWHCILSVVTGRRIEYAPLIALLYIVIPIMVIFPMVIIPELRYMFPVLAYAYGITFAIALALSHSAFFAAYYKMLTDKWPWER